MTIGTDCRRANAIACAPLRVLALVVMTLPWRLSGAADSSGDPLTGYYGNSLVCQNQKTHAVSHVWFDPDGRYYAFYDLGPQAVPARIEGPFEIEGWEGRYTLAREGAAAKVCLATLPAMKLAAERTRELFSEAVCYELAPHHVGDKWSIEWAGARYTLWLLEGR